MKTKLKMLIIERKDSAEIHFEIAYNIKNYTCIEV